MPSPDDPNGSVSPFRPLSSRETAWLARLFETSFQGREALVEQASRCTARRLDANGSLEFSSPHNPQATVDRRIPVEAEVEDEDGVTVHVLLHVLDGTLNELEIFREDSGLLHGEIDPARLRLLMLWRA